MITSDFIVGHEYQIKVCGVDSTGRIQKEEDSPHTSIVIRGKTATPAVADAPTASARFTTIFIAWTNPADADFKEMEVWGSGTNYREIADLLGVTSGNTFVHNVGLPNVTQYYWLRARNTSGVPGNYNPDTPTTTITATTETIASAYIENLNVSKLIANSTSTNEFASNTAQIKDAIITNAKINDLNVAKLTAGTVSSKIITLAVAAGAGDCYIGAGKTDFTNAQTGFILGLDDSDGDKPKFYIGSPTKYLNWDGTALTIRGTLNADDLVAGTVTGRIIQTAAAGARAEMNPVSGYGFRAWDDAANAVFQVYVAGADVGDVRMGDIGAGTNEVHWDKSAGTLTIRGTLNADDIVAGTVTGRTVQTAAAGQRVVIVGGAAGTFQFYDAGGVLVIDMDDDANGYAIFGDQASKEMTQIRNGSIYYWSETSGKGCVYGNYWTGVAWDTGTFWINAIGNAKFGRTSTGSVLLTTGSVYVATGKGYYTNNIKVVGDQGVAVANAVDAASVILRLNELLARCRTHGIIAT